MKAALFLALLMASCCLVPAEAGSLKLDTWNGMFFSFPGRVYKPRSLQYLCRVVRLAARKGKRVRVVGGRVHTWGHVSMSDENEVVVDMSRYKTLWPVDKRHKTITVGAGAVIYEVLQKAEAHGLTLAGQGAVVVQSVAGAVGTGTHGSTSGPSTTFSDQVVALTLMDHDGRLHRLHRGHPHFTAAQTNLGALGIVVKLTLRLVDSFYVSKKNYPQPFTGLTAEVIRKDLAEATHSVEYWLFPPYAETGYKTVANKLSVKEGKARETPLPPPGTTEVLFTQITQQALMEPFKLPFLAAGLTQQSVAAPEVVNDWRALSAQPTGSGTEYHFYDFLDTSYSIPLEKFDEIFPKAWELMQDTAELGIQCLIRFQKGSRSLMAMNNGPANQQFALIDFNYLNRIADHRVRPKMEKLMVENGARPHWGKLNNVDYTAAKALYGKNVDVFKRVKKYYDPKNMFGNKYTDTLLGLGTSA